MKKLSLKRVILYLSVIVILFTVISCPDPITEDVVAKVEDEASPTIIVSSPSNNDVYRSSVSFTGKVSDDAKNSIERFSFEVQNRSISGGVIISSGNVSQDSSAGTTPVSYNSSSGEFSFDFSTIDPDVLSGRLLVNLEAVDWNGNTTEETVILYENTDGEYVDITSPAAGDVYSTILSINATIIDQQVSDGDPISYENLNDITYQVIGTSLLQETLTIYEATPDGSGNINSGGDLTYNTLTGKLTGNISVASQSGTINFQLTVSDLNGHVVSKSFNISDGAVSPAVVLDSVFPDAFNGIRYFKEGEKIIIEGHVGYTKMDCDIFNYYITGNGSNNDAVDIVYTTIEDIDTGEKKYEFKDDERIEIATTASMDGQQKITFQFLADGSSETSSESVYFKNDFDPPDFDMAADPVTSYSTYYDINVKFDEEVWGGEYFSSILSVSDFSIKNSDNETLSIDSVEIASGSLGDGITEVTLKVLKSADNIHPDGTTEYYINSAGTSGSIGIFDVANNTPTTAGTFVFPDETAPYVISASHSPIGTISSYNYSGTVSFKFNEEVVSSGGTSGGRIQINSADSDACTIAANGVDISVSVPVSALNEGSNTISVPVGRFEDTSGNSNSPLYSWTVIKDTSPPSTTALEVKTGSETITANSTRGAVSNVDVILTFSDTDINKVAGKNLTLSRGGSTVTEIDIDSAVISDNKATITIPAANFDTSGTYQINIDSGAFVDSYDNPCALYTGLPFSFTLDISAPVTSALEVKTGTETITDGISRASISQSVDVKLTFTDTDITKVGGKYLRLTRDGSTVVNINASSASISDDNATFTIASSYFATSGTYTINIDSGAFEDSYGNPCTSYTDIPISFSVDSVKPSIDSTVPADNSTTATVSADLSVDFSENIILGAGSITLYKASNDSTVSAVVTVNNDIVTINPSSDLAAGTSYYVQIASNAVIDSAGNYFDGISDKTSWNFTTDPAPELAASNPLSPADGSTGVVVGSDLTVTFNETVLAGGGAVNIYNSDGSVFESVTVTSAMISGAVLTINPSSDFADGADYYVLINSDAVKDAAGNYFAGITGSTSWNFTTDPAPELAASNPFSPADGSTGVVVGSDLTVTFNENIYAGGGAVKIYTSTNTLFESITVTSSMISGAVLTINPSSDFTAGTSYYVQVDSNAVEDAGGNNFAGISDMTSWNFTTDPAPELAASNPFSPADGSTGVVVGSDLTVTFNENIYAGGGAVKIYTSTNTLFESITVTSSMISGAVLTINPSSDFAASTSYYVLIDSNAVKDNGGNYFAGIDDKQIWNFTTED